MIDHPTLIRCGIIGFGKMGRIRSIAIGQSPTAVVSRLSDLVEPADLDTGHCSFTKHTEDIIGDDGLDAIFICTPNDLIPALVIQALQSGKHVFAEKPPGFTAGDVEAIRAAEAKAGRKCMFGFNHRHHESIRRMKRVVSSGELGKLLWMRGRYGKEVDEQFFKGWRADPERAGGGILLDQGIHMLDLFIYLAGSFDHCNALISNLYWKIPELEDNAFILLRQEKTGVCASLHSTMTQWRYLFSLEVFLEGGSLVLNGLKTSSGAYGDETLVIKRNRNAIHDGAFQPDETYIFHLDTSWQSEVDHFFDAISNNTPIKHGNTSDALTLMQHLDRIYASDQRPRKPALGINNQLYI